MKFPTLALMPAFLMMLSPAQGTESPREQLAALEQSSAVRLGVCALDTADGTRILYRADERFPLCSTFKVLLVSAILSKADREDSDLLERTIHYTKDDLVTYSPVTQTHLTGGMTVAELCAAALQHSDNTAANLLLDLLGGPAAVTAHARTIGNTTFRLDRRETALNTVPPGDPRDTVTPAAMADSLQKIALGEVLTATSRKRFNDWMLGNTTGDRRIRAAVPADWQVGDKTGSGAYGVANDVAVLRPPGRSPILLAIYTRQEEADAPWQDDVIVAATRIVREALAPTAAPESAQGGTPVRDGD